MPIVAELRDRSTQEVIDHVEGATVAEIYAFETTELVVGSCGIKGESEPMSRIPSRMVADLKTEHSAGQSHAASASAAAIDAYLTSKAGQ